jgi:hypothetical protein
MMSAKKSETYWIPVCISSCLRLLNQRREHVRRSFALPPDTVGTIEQNHFHRFRHRHDQIAVVARK